MSTGRDTPERAGPASATRADRRWRPGPARWAEVGLLTGTAVLDTVGLSRSSWGNAFYAGAAQAGATRWSSWFFASSDAGNAITVDKPPAALWVMGLSVRLFGLSSWSVLLPQTVMALLAVAVLTATVRRVLGPWPGLLAGLLLALTPVLTLMARFDDPDMLLTLALVVAAWATVRAVQQGGTGWLLAAGAGVGLAVLAKSLEALLVLPGLAGAYLLAGPPALGRRLVQLVAAGVTVLVSCGWWFAAVLAVPRADRPWVGGTTDDDPLSLAFGYNGLGRLDGQERAGHPALHTAAGHWDRLLAAGGGQAGWLLPVAGAALLVGCWLRRGQPRTDPVRALLLLWGGWLLVGAIVLSTMQGIMHSYYAVLLAPAAAALVASTAALLWRRGTPGALVLLAVGTVGAVGWGATLVARLSGPQSGAGPAVLVCVQLALGLAAGASLVVTAARHRSRERDGVTGRPGTGLRRTAATLAVLGLLAGPAVWSAGTAARPHAGSQVAAAAPWSRSGPRPSIAATAAVLAVLGSHDAGYTWAAATVGEHGAALQLALGRPVISIGGFTGTDPAPSLAAFEADVAAHRVHWFLASGTPAGTVARAIVTWVRGHGHAVIAGGTTIWDLSAAG